MKLFDITLNIFNVFTFTLTSPSNTSNITTIPNITTTTTTIQIPTTLNKFEVAVENYLKTHNYTVKSKNFYPMNVTEVECLKNELNLTNLEIPSVIYLPYIVHSTDNETQFVSDIFNIANEICELKKEGEKYFQINNDEKEEKNDEIWVCFQEFLKKYDPESKVIESSTSRLICNKTDGFETELLNFHELYSRDCIHELKRTQIFQIVAVMMKNYKIERGIIEIEWKRQLELYSEERRKHILCFKEEIMKI